MTLAQFKDYDESPTICDTNSDNVYLAGHIGVQIEATENCCQCVDGSGT